MHLHTHSGQRHNPESERDIGEYKQTWQLDYEQHVQVKVNVFCLTRVTVESHALTFFLYLLVCKWSFVACGNGNTATDCKITSRLYRYVNPWPLSDGETATVFADLSNRTDVLSIKGTYWITCCTCCTKLLPRQQNVVRIYAQTHRCVRSRRHRKVWGMVFTWRGYCFLPAAVRVY